MKIRILLFILAISCSARANTPSLCEPALTMNGPTLKLVSYLNTLVEKKIIETQTLENLVDLIDDGQAPNPISQADAETSSRLLIHRAKIEKLASSSELQQKELRRWAIDVLAASGNERAQREKAREQTENLYQKMEFNLVPPGAYNTTNENHLLMQVPYSFELMSTPVTQLMWVELMHANPSHYKSGALAVEKTFDGVTITMVPDAPVTDITWWSALEFANRLSIKDGLEPVYDMSGIKFDGNASRGGLTKRSGTLKINEQANGYRLPTESEIEYVLSNLNEATVVMADHAWSAENSGHVIQPVATRLPLRLHGSDFYDLYGNVSEWTETTVFTPWGDYPQPESMSENHYRITFGDSGMNSNLNFRRRMAFGQYAASSPGMLVGFRLAKRK